MNAQTGKRIGAAVGAVVLVGAGAAGAAPALESVSTPSSDAVQASAVEAAGGRVAVADVQGDFSFDQGAVSSRETVAGVFAKASAVLCNGLPRYAVTELARAVSVSGDVDSPFTATVAEMAAKAETRELVMACACASNLPGGGAIVNAEVSGVTLESVANAAGA